MVARNTAVDKTPVDFMLEYIEELNRNNKNGRKDVLISVYMAMKGCHPPFIKSKGIKNTKRRRPKSKRKSTRGKRSY
jgi:hypothetical protein